MRTIVKLIGLAVLLLIFAGLFLFWSAGEFKQIEPHYAGTCNKVEGVVGAEDITIHPQTGMAYISSDDRRASLRGEPVPGAIYAYDLTQPDAVPVNLTPGADDTFHPHGISLYVQEEGADSLFVIDHAGDDEHSVEVFDTQAGTLTHRQSITDPLLKSPNDLVAIDEQRFYATNDHGGESDFTRSLEDYLQLPWANVVYYDGERLVEAASGIRIANGITLSEDGGRLYVAGTTDDGVHVYSRDQATGALNYEQFIELGTGVDNLELAQGHLWIGAHPQLLHFVSHVEDPQNRSPSQVIRVSPDGQGGYKSAEVYLNDGAELSGSSVAAVWRGRMLIGSVFEPYFLDCQLEP